MPFPIKLNGNEPYHLQALEESAKQSIDSGEY